MTLYAKKKFENSYNHDNLGAIEKAASEAIDYAASHYEYAVSETILSDDGILSFEFVEGQDIDEMEFTYDAQRNFEEKFAEIMRMEYPEI